MASSDLLYPIFVMPWRLSNLQTNYSFLIGGQLGQALCKLLLFFSNVSIVMLTQNLILVAVDRFGAVLFPLRLPLIRSKLCSFFILATWMFAMVFIAKDLLAFALVEYPEGARCVRRWKKVFGESSSFASLLLAYNILFTYIPVLLLVILYSIIFIKFKTQAHPGKQSTNNQQQRKRKNGNVLQMSIAIVTVFVLCWLPFSTNHLMIAYQDSSAHFSCSFQIYFDVTTLRFTLFIIVSLAANSLIVMTVYKTPNLRKPINYFIANMASSDLLFPIFFTPWTLTHLHTTSFLIGGRHGQAFCKPVPFFGEVSFKVSI